MKKSLSISKICFVLLVFLIVSCSKNENTKRTFLPKSKLVPLAMAEEVAKKFNSSKFLLKPTNKVTQSHSKTNLLDGTNQIKNKFVLKDNDSIPAIYIFNFENNEGFVVVAGDYSLRPILAYIDNGEYSENDKPEGFENWLNKTKENTELVRDGEYDNEDEGALAWRKYFDEYGVDTTIIAGKTMPINPDPNPCGGNPPPTSYIAGPLLPITWGQACSYNDQCALNQVFNCSIGCANGRPYTGCVATSMAQVIRYYQFPAIYNYTSMPANAGNASVQTLMKDAGNSVNMQYGCSGSGAYTSDVVNALKNTFHYTSANYWAYSSSSYNLGYGRVKTNIYNHWPVILSGRDASNSGHQWVCDGSLETTYYFGDCGTGNSSATYLNFHMNWGWHETWMNGTNITDYNGWFAFDNWTIYGRNLNFQYSKYAISEIHP